MDIKIEVSPNRSEFAEWLGNRPSSVRLVKQENFAYGVVELLLEIKDETEGEEFEK
tara:strand:+ start:236 stop:403 length:168 start_codon:yes stop_codon:yes gene_type:complete